MHKSYAFRYDGFVSYDLQASVKSSIPKKEEMRKMPIIWEMLKFMRPVYRYLRNSRMGPSVN
jgi:hypothetical protein